MSNLRILSIDGGGMRGVAPAVVLRALEQQTGQTISDMFHMIAGTSTGGILAAGLCTPSPQLVRPYSAAELVSLYKDHGEDIFYRSFWQRLLKPFGLWDELYSEEGLERVLHQLLGEHRLSEVDNVDLMLTAYNLERRKPQLFKSWRARGEVRDLPPNAILDPGHEDYALKDLVRATSAAPTYFKPARIKNGYGELSTLVDGGVFANNPSMCAISSALRIYDMQSISEVTIVSLGTGYSLESISYQQAESWGVVGWARPIIDILQDGVATTVNYQLATVLGKDDFFRFDYDLAAERSRRKSQWPLDRLDEPSAENLSALEEVAEYRVQSPDFQRLIQRLKETPKSPRDTIIAKSEHPTDSPLMASIAKPTEADVS